MLRERPRTSISGGGQAVNEPGSVTSDDCALTRPVFVSYATADRKEALSVCKAIERRGVKCWISCRDVAPGANYQEVIVRAIREARAMVLVFSDAANNSDEIKKELSLASRHQVPIMALRIEDVEPSDAFAYELSTRQWIDAFEGWDKSLDALNARLQQIAGETSAAAQPERRSVRRASMLPRRALIATASLALLLVAGVAGWLMLRPSASAVHPMQVRLADFQNLSPDLPATFPAAMRDEIISSFGKAQGGKVAVSTAGAPPPGNGPAYALGGTMRRNGDKIDVVARVTDERSGTMLWSDEFNYPGKALDKVPRWFAVDTTSVIGCALYGASTYPTPLPEKTLTLFFDVCGGHSNGQQLDAARRTVAATADFSAGWSAVAYFARGYAQQVPPAQQPALIREASAAADKAIQLDPMNSEAYVTQAFILPHGDLVAREALLKKAIAARPLACGCEHHYYGWFLSEVGRMHDALNELSRALDIDPLNPSTEVSVGDTLAILGMGAQAAQQHYDTAAEMIPIAGFPDHTKMVSAPITGDYAGALQALKTWSEPGLPPAYKAAMIAANEAMISGDLAAKAKAAGMIAALPDDFMGQTTMTMLGALGANQLALQQAEKMEAEGTSVRVRMWLWYPNMAGAIRDPSFPGVAQRLGLMRYWKTTHTRPDVCTAKDPPPFCRMI
jgi:tetratricopeptide (TPR) repeat protein